MKWETKCQIWEREDLNNTFFIIFNQIGEEFTNMIPGKPPLGFKPIVLVNDLLFDHRVYGPFDQEHYLIGLNITEHSYGEAAYQFAYELSHIYCDPRITNWAIKLIVHVSSFYILDQLTEKWETNPPEGIEKNSWEDFRNFKIDLMKEAYHKIDLRQHQHSSDWIKKEVKKIHERPELGNRIIFNVIALDILPIFKDDPILWHIIPFLCKSSSPCLTGELDDSHSMMEVPFDVNILSEICPGHLAPSLNKLVNQIWE